MELYLFEYPRFVRISYPYMFTIKRYTEETVEGFSYTANNESIYYALGIIADVKGRKDFAEAIQLISKRYKIDYVEYTSDVFFKFCITCSMSYILYDVSKKIIFTGLGEELIWESE